MLIRSSFVLAASCLVSGWSHRRAQEALLDSSKLVLDLFAFHKNLTEIESITNNEKAVGEWLASSLESQGYNVERQVVGEDPLRLNVLAWPGKVRDARVLLSSHIDTVPPFYPYKRQNGTISGRGSVDAKGSVATQIIAVNKLIRSGAVSANDLAVLYVVGEEHGGAGMLKANDLHLVPETVIFGEPTEARLVSGHKGFLLVDLEAKGRAAHSGYPWLGRSANEVLLAALTAIKELEARLPQSEKYGSTTFNIGQMSGGVAANVVAESAKATIAVRIADGTPDQIMAQIKSYIYRAMGQWLQHGLTPQDIINVDFPSEGYAPVDIDHDVPGFEVMTVNYGTDVPNFDLTGKHQRRYLYGPGSIFVAHSDHEALKEEDLTNAVDDYRKIILHALGKEERIDL